MNQPQSNEPTRTGLARAPRTASSQPHGQGLVEYALILMLVGVAAIGTLSILGSGVSNTMSNINDSLALSVADLSELNKDSGAGNPPGRDDDKPTKQPSSVAPTQSGSSNPPGGGGGPSPAQPTNEPDIPDPTKTPLPPATHTMIPVVPNTQVPSATNTQVSPVNTSVFFPTATHTLVPPTSTNTSVPTATNTPIPPTNTNTNTPVPPTATYTPTPGTSCTHTISAGDANGLKNAITAANSNAVAHDTICLAAGSTYSYSSGSNSTALPTITTQITIIGNGATIQRSSGSYRLFNVGASGTLTLENLSLRNGSVSGGNGGAVLSTGVLVLDSVSVTGSAARYGGAIHSSGSLTINGGTFSGNSATENGGAVYSASSTVIITSTLFETNTARYGSAFYLDAGTATVTNAVIRSNTASENGGGIYNRTGSLTVSGSQFTANRARHGAGISNHSTISVSNSMFTNNVAQESGGGIHNTANGSNRVQNSCFSGNTGQSASAFSSTASGNFNAKDNWWGSASAPTSAMKSNKVQASPHLSSCPN